MIDEKFTSIKHLISKIWNQITNRRQHQIIILLLAMLFGGVFELASIGAIIPFLGVLLSPDKILEYDFFYFLTVSVGATEHNEIIILLTSLFVILILFSSVYRAAIVWLNVRLSHAIGGDFEREVYRRTLYQPYETHTKHNLSTAITGINKAAAVTSSLLAMLSIVHGSVMVLVISLMLVVLDPYVSIVVFLTIGGVYFFTLKLVRATLRRNGEITSKNSIILTKWVQESLGGIRDILLEGIQEKYCEFFTQKTHQLKRAAGTNLVISQSPRLIIEPIGVAIIAAISCIIALNGDLSSKIPFLGAIAFAAQRLLPTAQLIYGSWTTIIGNQYKIHDVFQIIDQPIKQEFLTKETEQLDFKNKLELKNVDFKYLVSHEYLLKDISMTIEKGSCIGIIGKTGCGKSTLLDILLGLLTPTAGLILIDDKKMEGNVRQKWQRSIAHVPQDIYLTDTTVAENIAFGIDYENINFDRLQKAAHHAQLDEVINNMPMGFETIVGERGKKLSGGQRQRIGIARALYKQAQVLVFDEATSALDTQTEQTIVDEINSLKNEITLIIVTHRLSTLQHCDLIYQIDKGHIINYGTYDEVVRNNVS